MSTFFDISHTPSGFHACVVDTERVRRNQLISYLGFRRTVEEINALNTTQLPVRHWAGGELKKWR